MEGYRRRKDTKEGRIQKKEGYKRWKDTEELQNKSPTRLLLMMLLLLGFQCRETEREL